jgi:cytochrome c oxidase subunit 2
MVFEWLRPFTQVPNREISAALRFAVDVHETGGPNSERRRALERRRMAFFADRIDGRAILGRARASIDGGRAAIVGMVIGFASLAAGGAARAQDLPATGQPKPWQLGFQPPATPVMEDIENFHGNLVLPIVIVVALFVLALLLVVIFRFNSKANPIPSKLTHHTGLEIAWTVLPILILVVIAIPSFRLLYFQQVIPKADITIKATGAQWYWSYEYPDNGGIAFDANMIAEADLKPGQPRLLAVDNEVVVPVGKIVRVQVTGADVIHSFAMPSFGIKIDAIPGRLNETWFKAEREGVFYGQCSELCGTKHAFMPIAIRVVSDADFASWVSTKKAEMDGQNPNKVAAAAAN